MKREIEEKEGEEVKVSEITSTRANIPLSLGHSSQDFKALRNCNERAGENFDYWTQLVYVCACVGQSKRHRGFHTDTRGQVDRQTDIKKIDRRRFREKKNVNK